MASERANRRAGDAAARGIEISGKIKLPSNSQLPHQVQAHRRDEPVTCICGRRVERQSRTQIYCSERCRETARRRVRKRFLGADTGAPRTPHENLNKYSDLRWSESRSRVRIIGPAQVLAVEVLDRCRWLEATVLPDGRAR